MIQSKMRITTCSPATGSNFFSCTKVISRLIHALQNEHVLFLAPRRTGKTSVLLHLQKTAPAKVVFLDLEGFDHPDLWVDSMISAVGDWPYFIQLFIAELQEHCANQPQFHDVTAIYQSVAYGEHNQYSDNMWTRLRDIFNHAETDIAQKLLRSVAVQETGIPLASLRSQLPQIKKDDFACVFDALQHDGYLILDGNGCIQFSSNLLRDYWRRKVQV